MGHWEQTWGRGSAPRVWAHLHAVPCPKACWGSTAAAPHLGPWGSLWGHLGCCLTSGGLWASPIPRGDPVSAGQAHGRRLARENVPGIPNISRRAHRSLRLLLGLSHAAAGTASSIPATFRGAAGRVLLGWLPLRSRQHLQGFSTAGWAQISSPSTVTGLTSLPRARGDRQLLPTTQHAAPP